MWKEEFGSELSLLCTTDILSLAQISFEVWYPDLNAVYWISTEPFQSDFSNKFLQWEMGFVTCFPNWHTWACFDLLWSRFCSIYANKTTRGSEQITVRVKGREARTCLCSCCCFQFIFYRNHLTVFYLLFVWFSFLVLRFIIGSRDNNGNQSWTQWFDLWQ